MVQFAEPAIRQSVAALAEATSAAPAPRSSDANEDAMDAAGASLIDGVKKREERLKEEPTIATDWRLPEDRLVNAAEGPSATAADTAAPSWNLDSVVQFPSEAGVPLAGGIGVSEWGHDDAPMVDLGDATGDGAKKRGKKRKVKEESKKQVIKKGVSSQQKGRHTHARTHLCKSISISGERLCVDLLLILYQSASLSFLSFSS